MDELISREAAIKKLKYRYPGVGVDGSKERLRFLQYIADVEAIKEVPSAEPKIIRCKDCKHRPSGTGVNHDLEFPHDDYKCPCQCEDFWYSWMPDDDWYCANGERREDG